MSETMKQKMASFTGSPVRETGKVGREARDSREGSTQRTIKPDNKFQDKLRAFKTIETLGVKEVSPAPTEKINR